MYRVEHKLQFDPAVSLPPTCQGLWFPGTGNAALFRRRIVWLANTTPDSSQLYRFDSECGVELVVVGAEAFGSREAVESLGGVPLSPWLGGDATQQVWRAFDAAICPQVIRDCGLMEVDGLHFWTPRFGLLRLEESHRTGVTEFLTTPPASSLVWEAPPSVAVRYPAIHSLQPSELPDVAALLMDGNDDISADVERFSDLTKDDALGVGERMRRWLVQKLDEMGKRRKQKQAESQGSGSGSSKSAGQSAGAGLPGMVSRAVSQFFSKQLEGERERQIEKLLSMMRSDPDRALRFAIPIGGGEGFRGFSMPGSSLIERLPDFSLSGIWGSGPVDSWSLGFDLQNRLRQSYHDQLNRAIAAGMHRRAAYIAAHLLGDYTLAASTLEKGGHFSEAAVVYLEKLKRPRDAARCLANAGQWEKASDLYWEMGDLETAGDVLRDAEQEEAAVQAYEDAVARYRSGGRVFDAVGVLTGKLASRDRALELLWQQWPSGSEAVKASERAFAMLSESGEHDEVRARLRWIAEVGGEPSAFASARVCSAVAKLTPDDDIRVMAADACRVAAVRGIGDVSPLEADQRMDLIGRLDDPLQQLRKDTRRFSEQFRQQRREQQQVTPASSSKLTRVECFDTKLDRVLFADRGPNQRIRLIGIQDGGSVLRVRSGTGDSFSHTLACDLDALHGARFTTCSDYMGPIILFGELPAEPTLPIDKRLIDVRNTAFGSADEVAITDSGTLFALKTTGEEMGRVTIGRQKTDSEFEIDGVYDVSRNVMEKYGIDALAVFDATQLVAMRDSVFLAGHHFIGKLGPDRLMWIDGVPSIPISLDAALSKTRQRIAAVEADALAVYWAQSGSFRREELAEGTCYQRVRLLAGGRLIAVTESSIELYQLNRHGYRKEAEAPRLPAGVVAVLRGAAGEFAVAYEDGRIESWRTGV